MITCDGFVTNFVAWNAAPASGCDDVVFSLQARHETAERAVLMTGATLNEKRLDARVRGAERVDRDAAVHRIAIDDSARQQRHAHVGGDAADHAVERAELEACG